MSHLLECLSVANLVRPKKALETIKGISEQKATKILIEGKPSHVLVSSEADIPQLPSWFRWASPPRQKCISAEVS